MNCDESRQHIYECLDRDMTPEERSALDAHLAECPDCRGEQSLLAHDRRLLASVEQPHVRLNASRLYHRELVRWQRSQRRWRRWAIAGMAASLLLAIWLGVGMRVEVGAQGLSVFWNGQPSGVGDEVADVRTAAELRSPDLDDVAQVLALQQQRIDELNELIGLVAAEIDNSRARERRAILAAIQKQLELERRANDSRMKTLGRSVHMLHLAQLNTSEPLQGDGP